MKKFISSLFILATLCACQNNAVSKKTNVYQSADYEHFETWSWFDQAQDDTVNEILHDHIQYKIEQELISNEYDLKENGSVDFLVGYIINTRDDLEVEKLPTYEGYSDQYYGIDRWGYMADVTTFQFRKKEEESRNVKKIVKGTLIIDIINPEDNKLMIRMIAEKPIGKKATSSEERKLLLDRVIKELLSTFPPTPQQN